MKKLSVSNYLIPLVLFLSSLLIRLALISKGPYHLDCLSLALAAQGTFETGRLHLEFGPGYPLTILLGSLFIGLTRIFGNTDPIWAVNLMSVVCSSGSVVVLYLIVKQLFDAHSAVFAAIMFSVFPIFIGISVYGKSHTPSLLFWLMSILAAVRYRTNFKKKDFFLSCLFLGFMGAARVQDMILVTPAWLFLCCCVRLSANHTQQKLNNGKMFGQGFLIIVGLVLIFHLWQIAANRDTYGNQFSRFWQVGAANNFRGLLSPSLGISLIMITFGLSPAGTAIALLGLGRIARKQTSIFIFFILWLMIPLLFYGNLNTTAPRFLMISVIPMILAQGYFFGYLILLKSRLYKILTLFSFAIIVWLILGQMLPILLFRHRHDLLPAWGRFIEKVTEPQALIITGDEAMFISHYGHRQILSRPKAVFAFNPGELEEFLKRLDQLLQGGIPVYITNTGLKSYDPGKLFSNMILSNFTLIPIVDTYTEDWHHGETILRVGKERLYRINKKI